VRLLLALVPDPRGFVLSSPFVFPPQKNAFLNPGLSLWMNIRAFESKRKPHLKEEVTPEKVYFLKSPIKR